MKRQHYTTSLIYILGMFVYVSALHTADAAETYSPFYNEQTKTVSTNKTSVYNSEPGESILNIETVVTTDETHPFSGSEEQMNELEKLEPINDNLKAAVDAHNAINRLRSYKNIQKQYNNTVKLHDKSVELLKQSEQCTINFMGRYFKNPIKVWSGKNMSSIPQNHDLREGLSAWAIAMFETAKSAEVSPIDISDVVSVDTQTKETTDSSGNVIDISSSTNSTTSTIGVDVNEKNTTTNLEDLHKDSESQIDTLEKETDGTYFKEPSRQEELEASDRKTDLISKDVGAEVALWMANYLSGYDNTSKTSPDWNSGDLGGVKKRFPVWTDQKTFYGQYLLRKYNNIKEYIKNYEIPSNTRELVADKIYERQKEYQNAAETQITQAAINARLQARNIYEENKTQAYQQYEKDKAAIQNEQATSIESLNNEKNKKIAEYESKITDANQKRDQYMTQISDINEQNSNLSREITSMQQEINGYAEMLTNANLTEEQKSEYMQIKADIEQEIASIQSKINQQLSKKEELQVLYDEQSDAIEKIKQEQTKYEGEIQAKIGEINNESAIKQQDILTTYNKKIQEEDKKLADKNSKIDAAEIAAKAAIGSKSMITAEKIINQADITIEDARDIAYNNVEKVVAAFQALGDELYRGNAQDIITSYHQALIDSLKGKEAQVGGLKLETASAKVHDLTNFNADIVISADMDKQMRELYLDNYRQAVKNTNTLLTVSAFDKMLKDVYTGVDSQYFVGSEPKKEDFTTPKALPDYNLPPLREYVRLDYIDLQSIGKDNPKMEVGEYKEIMPGTSMAKKIWVKTEDMPISIVDKEKFLSYGGRIPEIWKLMLKDKAFVDSDFYLTPSMDSNPQEEVPPEYNPLQLGAEMSPLYRGGIYPCVIKNIQSEKGICNISGIENGTGIVDVVITDKGGTNANEYFMGLNFVDGERLAELKKQDLPECQEIKAECKRSMSISTGFGTKAYITPIRKKTGATIKSKNFVTEGDASELGSILNVYSGRMISDGTIVENALGYSPYMQSVVNYGIRMEERGQQEDAPELNEEEQLNDDIYVRAQYNNNQVGDFLDHVEIEQKYQQALDEAAEEVKEAKEELYNTLREFGFEPSADFDISKEEDYELAVTQLKTAKNNYMSQAKAKIESIEPGDSDVLAESQASYRRIYQGLMLDSECVVSMTMDVDNISDFSEQIKTATTNTTVDETYEKNGDENFEDTLRAMQPAYCAIY